MKVFAFFLSAFGTGLAFSDVSTVPSGPETEYELIQGVRPPGREESLCWSIDGGEAKAGTKIVLDSCDENEDAQHFSRVPHDDLSLEVQFIPKLNKDLVVGVKALKDRKWLLLFEKPTDGATDETQLFYSTGSGNVGIGNYEQCFDDGFDAIPDGCLIVTSRGREAEKDDPVMIRVAKVVNAPKMKGAIRKWKLDELEFNYVETTSTATPPTTTADCISDTDVIFDAEAAVSDFSQLRTYVLCPDTTFDIGDWDDDWDDGAGRYTNGMAALDLGSPNMHILCGENGKRENNCVLRGGYEQVFVANLAGADLTNVLVKGVTFREAVEKVVSASAKTAGDGVIFEDCVFEDNTQVTAIVDAIPTQGGVVSTLDMTITLDSCTFRNNSPKRLEGHRIFGLIWNHNSIMNIRDCEFIDNHAVVDDPINQDVGSFIIINAGESKNAVSKMEISGCTFRDNVVSSMLVYEEFSAGTVVSDTIAEGNTFFVTAMTDDYCEGVATFLKTLRFEFECKPFPAMQEPAL